MVRGCVILLTALLTACASMQNRDKGQRQEILEPPIGCRLYLINERTQKLHNLESGQLPIDIDDYCSKHRMKTDAEIEEAVDRMASGYRCIGMHARNECIKMIKQDEQRGNSWMTWLVIAGISVESLPIERQSKRGKIISMVESGSHVAVPVRDLSAQQVEQLLVRAEKKLSGSKKFETEYEKALRIFGVTDEAVWKRAHEFCGRSWQFPKYADCFHRASKDSHEQMVFLLTVLKMIVAERDNASDIRVTQTSEQFPKGKIRTTTRKIGAE